MANNRNHVINSKTITGINFYSFYLSKRKKVIFFQINIRILKIYNW